MKPKENTQGNDILFGFAERRRGPSGKWIIRFRFARIGIAMVVFAAAVYLAFATLFYFIFKYQKKYAEVTYTQILMMPFASDDLKEKRGDYHIRHAKELIEQGKHLEAFNDLRTGVNLSPTNLEGRLMLSQFQFLTKNAEGAMQTLRDGIPYAIDNTDFIKAYVSAMFQFQHDFEVIDVCNRLLADKPSNEAKEVLAMAIARAHFFRGQYDQAEDTVTKYSLDESIEGTLLSAELSWLRGQRQAAIEKLQWGETKFPQKDPFYAYLSRFYREEGELDKAKHYAVLRNINAPLSISPRINLLSILDAKGEKDRSERQAYEILAQFSKDEDSVLQLANYATEAGRISLMRRIYETALENSFAIAPFALLVIECHITAEDYTEAVSFSEELAKENPDWLDQASGVFNSLRAVAYYGLGNKDLCQLYLKNFLDNTNVRPDVHLAVSRRFEILGARVEALRVLELAYKNNPENQNALTRLIALELEQGNSSLIGGYLKRLLQMRRPSQTVLNEAYQRLGSDRFIFTPDRENILIELRSLLAGKRKS